VYRLITQRTPRFKAMNPLHQHIAILPLPHLNGLLRRISHNFLGPRVNLRIIEFLAPVARHINVINPNLECAHAIPRSVAMPEHHEKAIMPEEQPISCGRECRETREHLEQGISGDLEERGLKSPVQIDLNARLRRARRDQKTVKGRLGNRVRSVYWSNRILTANVKST